MPTLAGILARHGYRTAGVYSAPYLDPHWGLARGFDRYDAAYGPEVAAPSREATELRARIADAAAARDWARYDTLKWRQVEVERALNRSAEVAVTSEAVTATVLERLDEVVRDPRPWFVFAHFFDAHCDYVPPPPYDRRFDPTYTGPASGAGCLAGPAFGEPDPTRPGGLVRTVGERDLEHVVVLYEGEVAWVDAHVGAILRALEAKGLADTTLVIVVSDHGEEFFEHGGLGHRHTLFEEVVRIPMLLRLPGVLPTGAAIRGPVSLADVVPTILDVLGLADETGRGTQSFLPLVRGAEDPGAHAVLARLVMMFEGSVQVDAGEPIALRQIMVQDAYRTGALKVLRTRRWPQFPTDVPAETAAIVAPVSAEQYGRETIEWVDVAGSASGPEGAFSTDLADARVRTALDGFRRDYARVLALRRGGHAGSPVPEHVRRNLESLGYVEPAAGPKFPEPAVVLPPPRAG